MLDQHTRDTPLMHPSIILDTDPPTNSPLFERPIGAPTEQILPIRGRAHSHNPSFMRPPEAPNIALPLNSPLLNHPVPPPTKNPPIISTNRQPPNPLIMHHPKIPHTLPTPTTKLFHPIIPTHTKQRPPTICHLNIPYRLTSMGFPIIPSQPLAPYRKFFYMGVFTPTPYKGVVLADLKALDGLCMDLTKIMDQF